MKTPRAPAPLSQPARITAGRKAVVVETAPEVTQGGNSGLTSLAAEHRATSAMLSPVEPPMAVALAAGVDAARAIAERTAANPIFATQPTAIPMVDLPLLDTRAPGQAPEWARTKIEQKLPNFSWPTTPGEAETLITDAGYSVIRAHGDTRVYAKGFDRLTLVGMELAGMQGYAVGQGDTRHVQLGPLTFSSKEWGLFEDAYSSTIDQHNTNVTRPLLLNGSPLPADGSPLHGPQDGMKHWLHLGEPLDSLTTRRIQAQELVGIEGALGEMLEFAKKHDIMPALVVVEVEGPDAANKTGNGNAVSRAFARNDYQADAKGFRAPKPEELIRGPMARFEDFIVVDPKPGEKVLRFSDRTALGNYAYDQNANLTEVAAGVNALDQKLKDRGALVLKFLFLPGTETPMAAFGRRLGRAVAAEDLPKRRAYSEVELESLRIAATMKPGVPDFKSVKRPQDSVRFQEVAEASGTVFPWAVIDSSERHPGRVTAREVTTDNFMGWLTARVAKEKKAPLTRAFNKWKVEFAEKETARRAQEAERLADLFAQQLDDAKAAGSNS